MLLQVFGKLLKVFKFISCAFDLSTISNNILYYFGKIILPFHSHERPLQCFFVDIEHTLYEHVKF